jgi:hypothetical protein
VRNTLQCLLAEEGFADQPVGGCPATSGDQGKVVHEIVQGVLAELQRRGIG